MIHVDTKILGLFLRLGAPDFLQQLTVRDDLAMMLNQYPQQGVLSCRNRTKTDYLPVPRPPRLLSRPCGTLDLIKHYW